MIDRLCALGAFYVQTIQIALARQLQHRAHNLLFVLGMVAEPLVYLAVWSTVARARGGQVAGYTDGKLAAYYIVWTLVRHMNIVFTPYGFEGRIRSGKMSGLLLLPLHPIHHDLADFAGLKLVTIVTWIPIALVLAIAFRPALDPGALQIFVFCVAIWGAFVVRSTFMWALGLLSFWTTRVAALFELYLAIELVLSGRLVPMSFLPAWTRAIAAWLPFQWAFAFPIESLVTPMAAGELLYGLAMQLGWICMGALLVSMVWRRAVRRYTAVGG